jgi:hypothetical protein
VLGSRFRQKAYAGSDNFGGHPAKEADEAFFLVAREFTVRQAGYVV